MPLEPHGLDHASAVSGLTNDDAPSAAVAPSGRTGHWSTGTQRYCGTSHRRWRPRSCRSRLAPQGTSLHRRPRPRPRCQPAWRHRAARHAAHRAFRHARRDHGALGRAAGLAVLMSAAPNSRPRSDGLRRGFHADEHFIRAGLRRVDAVQRQLEFATALDLRTKLKCGGHSMSPRSVGLR